MKRMQITEELTLDSLFMNAEALPSPPIAVLEIVRNAEDPEVSLAELARLIEYDVGLAVQILRIANSALYAPISEITTIERAIATLGLRSVRLLAFSASLRMLIPDQAQTFDTSDIRRRMVINGSLARKFAVSLASDREDEAFLAGLLTGLGPIVLAAKHGDLCREMSAMNGSWPSTESERVMLGFTTNEVTVNLVRRWGLPEALCDAIERRTEAPTADDSPLLRTLRLSFLAENVLCGPDPSSALLPLLVATEAEMGLSLEETNEWLVEAEPLVAQMADLLQFRVPQVQTYSELLIEATLGMQRLTLETNSALVEGNRQLEALSQMNRQLQHQASTDALTQLPNRGLFDEMLASRLTECRASAADDQSLGVLLLDLDHFKLVNDTYGHTVGDEVLRVIGAILKQQTRGDDMPARYGGEEFIVLLPATNATILTSVAERLRQRIADTAIPLPDGGRISVTASIGGALAGEEQNETGPELVERADKRLYEAKRSGRNRVVIS